MRTGRAIWTILSFFISVITIIVILRFFGLTVKDVTDSLSEGFGFLRKIFELLADAAK